MRCFISIDLNDEDVKDSLVNFMDEIERYGDIKTVSPENLHVTLLFLGERDEEEMVEVRSRFNEACEKLDVDEFVCEVTGVGVFPHMNYINTIWLGAEPDEKFRSLHMKFNEVMNGQNEDDFVAHVTVGRVRGLNPEDKDDLKEKIESHPGDFGSFRVENVKLKESHLAPHGPEYRDLEVCPL